MPPVGQNFTSASGEAKAFSEGDAAGLLGREEFQEAQAGLARGHDLAGRDGAGQQRNLAVARPPPEVRG